MAVDLHTHSTYSDGSETPAELIATAKRARLEAIALTDHDNLDGIPEAMEAAAHHDIELIPGVELSCEWDRGGFHMVVLWLEPGSGPLQDRLADLQRGRANRNVDMVAELAGLGIDITYDEVLEEAGGTGVGRPHMAAILVRKGVVETMSEAFDLYLAQGRPGYVGRVRLTPETAITLARQSGAVPIIAHPHTLGIFRSELDAELKRLAGLGLVGVEAYYPEYEPDTRFELVERARQAGLVPSGGSDYHGGYKQGLKIGNGYGDLAVDRSVLEELRAAQG
ncbi:MAG: PHP domain-containing protein [Acidimicrobiia bacterium]|nr:PHP domain-containing protein [Acidimicrobiia bacterium]MBT8193080.1 PHP domain-containing protein [Acidimicrobiia bacterium]MBT8248413.1 PHP domain-containing protein [Acidimicrobiia bacterium]